MTYPLPSVSVALVWGRARIDPLDAKVLLCHALGCSSAHLSAWPERTLSEDTWRKYQTLVVRRERGEPTAYLTGWKEFYGRTFMVSPAVLIPRPETELLVEIALAHFQEKSGIHLLDLGTGSGILAITLALELDKADVTAVDQSLEASYTAMANAARLGASISFVQSDWFSAIEGDLFHLIVSNPPYVAENDERLLHSDIRFEPHSALASGPNGLDDLIRIIEQAPHHLETGGLLLVEHGYDQSVIVRSLLLDAGFSHITSWRDLSGIERVSGGRWEGKK